MFSPNGDSSCTASPNWFTHLSRTLNRYARTGDAWSKKIDRFDVAAQVIVDAEIVILSVLLAYVIRFEGHLEVRFLAQLLLALPWIVIGRLILMWRGGVYRFLPKYFALPDVIKMGRLHAPITFGLLALRFFYPFPLFEHWVQLPLSVITLEALLSFGGLVTVRTLQRTRHEDSRRLAGTADRKRVLLYGAGSAGVALCRQLAHDSNVEVMGFIDDDPAKVGRSISGHTVLASAEGFGDVVARYQIRELIITIANCSRLLLSRILSKCQELQIPAKVVPSLEELVQGSHISQVRDVSIELILGRDGVRLHDLNEELRDSYAHKRILVTGAGGSIGSELVRQLLLCGPEAIAMLDKDENSIYELEQELCLHKSSTSIECHITDIRLRERLLPLLQSFKPEIVFHAAAHKHVPLMEKHPCEAILNNVYGTHVLLETCYGIGVERFIFISTDKAVNPTSIMGATKRIGEMLVQHYSSQDLPRQFTCVRFGNVIGSRGSFIPLFHRQIAKGGPITVTHPDMVRYFMSIPEAVQLVLHAGRLGKRGEVFVLELGTARKIIDVACEIARLSGLEPGRDIDIAITGLRPGEKLTEELVAGSEQVCPTAVDKLLMVVPAEFENGQFMNHVEALIADARTNDVGRIYDRLASMNIGFQSKDLTALAGDLVGNGHKGHAA